MKRIIFACVHNAGRSQMAAAFFNALADPAKALALSAGTEPAAHVHPEVVDVMSELGFDLSSARPRRLTTDLASQAELLVTMGCDEACPYVPGLRREDWNLSDPKGRPLAEVRIIRDEVRRHVESLVRENDWDPSTPEKSHVTQGERRN
jgi:arsenate reductase